MEIPEGYRKLNNGEIIKEGDKYGSGFLAKGWSYYPDIYFNKKLDNSYPPSIRLNELIKEIEFTDEQKNSIINKLNSERAFNKDSAFKIDKDNLNLYYSLFKKGLIKKLNENKFYL